MTIQIRLAIQDLCTTCVILLPILMHQWTEVEVCLVQHNTFVTLIKFDESHTYGFIWMHWQRTKGVSFYHPHFTLRFDLCHDEHNYALAHFKNILNVWVQILLIPLIRQGNFPVPEFKTRFDLNKMFFLFFTTRLPQLCSLSIILNDGEPLQY